MKAIVVIFAKLVQEEKYKIEEVPKHLVSQVQSILDGDKK